MFDKFTQSISGELARKMAVGAAHGLHKSGLAANLAGRAPGGLGQILSVAVRIGGAVGGAVEAYNDHTGK